MKYLNKYQGAIFSSIIIMAFTVISLILIFPSESLAATANISASKDTYLDQKSTNANDNYGGAHSLYIRSQSGDKNKRTLIGFDISSLPAGATIQSATLKLYVNGTPNTTRNYGIYRKTANWTEGGATWNNAASTYAISSTDIISISASNNHSFVSWNVTADVDNFYSGATNNYGWLIRDQSENNSSEKEVELASRDDSHTSQHPQLEITYTIPGPTTATLIVVKNVINNNGGTKAPSDFTLHISNGVSSTPSTFNGSAGGTTVIVAPGTYAVSEDQASGYAMNESTDCSGSITAGETKTCTITNDDVQPQLTVIKQVINDNGGAKLPSDFTINVSGVAPSPASFSGNASGTLVTLNAGQYSITETAVNGYNSTSTVDCVGVINIGEHKTCTITNNDITSTLTVIKQVINSSGGTAQASDFTMQVSAANAAPASFAGSENGTPVTLNAGAYSVSENGPTGYSSSASTDCSGTIELWQNKICTITNTDIAPKLTVTKVVINDNGGTAQVSDFPLFVDTTQVTSGVQNSFNAGQHVVSETNQSGYASTFSGDCDSQGSITLSIGDVKTCTITNDDFPPPPSTTATLIVIKQVINDNGGANNSSDFTIVVSGTNVSQGTFPGNASGTTITLDAGQYSVDEVLVSGYAKTLSNDCAGTIAANETKTCTITNDDVQQSQPQPPSGGGGGLGLAGGGIMSYGGARVGQVLGANISATATGPIAPAALEGKVLGATTQCGIYLTTSIKRNAKNNPEEVKKLQQFLNDMLGTNLPINGKYGPLTEAAVRRFQVENFVEVLKPWVPYGLKSEKTSTGYVYKTTKRWINMIKCPELNLPISQLP